MIDLMSQISSSFVGMTDNPFITFSIFTQYNVKVYKIYTYCSMFLTVLYKGENIHNNVHFVEINSTEIVIILISRQRRRKREKERVI